MSGGNQRKSKAWIFEQLEDRNLFAVAPLDLQFQYQSLSSATTEGQLAIEQRELAWWETIASSGSAGSGASAQAPTTSADAYTSFLRSLPTDPYLLADPSDPTRASQWHLINTGQQVGNPDSQVIYGVVGEDINVASVWQGQGLQKAYTGKGVVVAVIDSGVQTSHPDLAANISPTLRYNAITGTNNPNPQLFDPGNAHGTAVAGLIAADNNGIGGVGVAYDATIAPILLIGSGLDSQVIENAFRFQINQVDITNNSWGPNDIPGGRGTNGSFIDITPNILLAIRDSIEFGRDGLGVIHVFASGNSAGPGFNPPFNSIGTMDVASFDSYVNSRYTIGVTGVDHDGLYANVDGTFTAYPEIGTSVLVAAPTGSNAFLDIADDTGLGSGIVTTDFTGNNGYNFLPIAGVELDRDFLPNGDYTSRFNGTSAAAPIASGVIALMLEANPNLNWRDVQEILVRSARQNAQFEDPSSGAGLVSNNTWQTNQLSFFQDPDPFMFAGDSPDFAARFTEVYEPVADPALHHTQMWTTAAGYTVSMGFGVYGESTGFAHGVVDAQLAVQLAENWHSLAQNRAPELTFSTFVLNTNARLRAAQKAGDDAGQLLVPGGFINTGDGFIDYWDEYFVDDDPESMDDGPFSGDDPPGNLRGQPYIEFNVPDEVDKAMTVETVELKFGMSGPTEDLDQVKIILVSPEGTFSEFNPFAASPSFLPFSIQQGNNINLTGDLGNIDPDGSPFTWTFSTNRSWGERTSDAWVIDPATLEPAVYEDFSNDFGAALIPTVGQGASDPFLASKGWRIYFENWSASDFTLNAIELTFHGNPIPVGTQRVQGVVGFDTDDNDAFNFTRYNQIVQDNDGGDVLHNRISPRGNEVQNLLDTTQEKFAENVLVSAYKVVGGTPLSFPEAQFVTGADGNYYFDLAPGEYIIRATDLSDPLALPSNKFKSETDLDTYNSDYMPKYLSEWHITEDWFYAPDRVYNPAEQVGEPGHEDHHAIMLNDDGTPKAFEDTNGTTFAMGPRYLNFLVDPGDVPQNSVSFAGTVYADLNGDGVFNGEDAPASGGFFVYWDENRNNVRDSAEALHEVNADGSFTISVAATAMNQIAIGVVPPNSQWEPTNPALGVRSFLAGPGDELTGVDFLFEPPSDVFDPSGNQPGNIMGLVFGDRNGDGVRQSNELGVAGFKVYADANENGQLDDGEIFGITASNGAYFLANVPRGNVRVDIVVPESWGLTSPAIGYRDVELPSGNTISNVRFGVMNLATSDWGDLPNSYNTSSANNGARHTIVAGFNMGSLIDGEVSGVPTADASGDDALGSDEDGIVLLGAVSNPIGALVPGTTNAVRATLNGVGGYLNAWFDFNRDGDFNDAGEHAVVDSDLNPGIRDVTFAVPSGLVGGPIAARFRWGTIGIGYAGADIIGEVEDYYLANSVQQSVITTLPGDYNNDKTVNDADYTVWRNNFGSTTNLAADGNGDGRVDASDYSVWRDHFGQSLPAGGGSSSTGGGSGSGALSTSTVPGYTPVSEAMAAQLESLGYVATTIRVGSELRTVYMLPSAANAGSGSGSVAPTMGPSTGDSTTVARQEISATESDLAETPPTDSTTETAVTRKSHERHGRSHHRAARVDSALLVLAATSGRLGREQDGEACDMTGAWGDSDDDSNSAVDLALASFEAQPKWRRLK